MNKVCADGTGAFSKNGNKLGIEIAGVYEEMAMRAKAPYRLTSAAPFTWNQDLMSYLQMGGAVEDLLAGLSQAVVHNYLNRVVQDGRIGNRISFQGGPSLTNQLLPLSKKSSASRSSPCHTAKLWALSAPHCMPWTRSKSAQRPANSSRPLQRLAGRRSAIRTRRRNLQPQRKLS
jgi:hypothetical protein